MSHCDDDFKVGLLIAVPVSIILMALIVAAFLSPSDAEKCTKMCEKTGVKVLNAAGCECWPPPPVSAEKRE